MPGSIKIDDGSGNYTILTNGGSLGSDKTITIPNTTGTVALTSDVSAITEGITDYDQWCMTADLTSSTDPISANLSRMSGTLRGAYKGSGMSVSSGIWTFPTTGHWYVKMNALVQFAGYASGFVYILASNDNFSTESTIAFRQGQGQTNYDKANLVCENIIDVTDTSNDKIKFKFYDESIATLAGNSDGNETSFTFIRLGDT